MSKKRGNPGSIALVSLLPRVLPHGSASGHEHLDRVAQHMLSKLPGDTRALQGDHGAMVVLHPRAQRDQFTGGSLTVVERCRDLARVTDPAQTRGELGGKGVKTAADRMDYRHRASLFGDVRLAIMPALD